MTTPDFLNSSIIPYYYSQTTGMTDVNTIISDVRTALVTNLGWSEPTTARFKTPVDSAGKFFDILLTRVTATNLEILMRDYRGTTLYDRRIQIDATAAVNYFCSKFSFFIESLRATSECAWGSLLDLTPGAISDVDNKIIGSAFRTTADSADGNGSTISTHFGFDSGSAAATARLMQQNANTGGSAIATMSTGAGTLLYREVAMTITQAGNIRWTGRMYQALVGDATISFGSDKTVPIDDGGTTATFRCVGLTTANQMRLLLRKAG